MPEPPPPTATFSLTKLNVEVVKALDAILGLVAANHFTPELDAQREATEEATKGLKWSIRAARDSLQADLDRLETAQGAAHEVVLAKFARQEDLLAERVAAHEAQAAELKALQAELRELQLRLGRWQRAGILVALLLSGLFLIARFR